VRLPLRGRRFDLDALLAEARSGARLIYLANPNNQTGVMVERAELVRFVDELPERTLCVLDEAYAEYADEEPPGIELVREGRPQLCALRTFSKVYGLAAMRVGYAIASPEIADALDRVRNIFNVNQPAQEAALASLEQEHEVRGRIEHARRSRRRLHDALAAAGLVPEPSQANFVYADVPHDIALGDGELLAGLLLREGIMIRALGGFGAPGAIRVTAGTDAENELFAEVLARIADATT
jgi:histidinol-phosphate aminotransferase